MFEAWALKAFIVFMNPNMMMYVAKYVLTLNHVGFNITDGNKPENTGVLNPIPQTAPLHRA